MNPTVLKRFDRTVGEWLARWIDSRPEQVRLPNQPRRILVIRLWAIGESLLALPAIKALKERYPQSELTVLTTRGVRAVFARQSFVDDMVVVKPHPVSIGWFILRHIRSYDLAIDFEPFMYISAIAARVVGRYSIGFNTLKRGTFYSRAVNYDADQHVVETNMDLVAEVGVLQEQLISLVPIVHSDTEKKRIRRLLASHRVRLRDTKIVIIPGGGGQAAWRRWDPRKFARAADSIAGRYGCTILLLGDRWDAAVIERVRRHMQTKPVVIRSLRLPEAAYLLRMCQLTIANDSGLMHVSAAAGTPTIGLFGPETPAKYGPYGANHRALYHQQRENPVIRTHEGLVPGFMEVKYDPSGFVDAISVEEVVAAAGEIIRSGHRRKYAYAFNVKPNAYLIVGQPKSGTTVLYFALKRALPDATCCWFEPQRLDQSLQHTSAPLLAKILLHPGWVKYEDFDWFAKQVLLVRDPRDAIVSTLLYHVLYTHFSKYKAKVRQFVRLLERKERSPQSVSFLDLIALRDKLEGRRFLDLYAQRLAVSERWHANHPDAYVQRYEDLIAGEHTKLERYLEIDALTKLEVPGEFSRVVRTKGSGSWRNWFLPQDVTPLRSLFYTHMRAYGYNDEWELAENPAIQPEHASQYVQRILREKAMVS